MDPGRVWWSWNIFDGGPAVAFIQGVNKRGYCNGKGRLLEVVVTHGVEGRVLVRGKVWRPSLIVRRTRVVM